MEARETEYDGHERQIEEEGKSHDEKFEIWYAVVDIISAYALRVGEKHEK